MSGTDMEPAVSEAKERSDTHTHTKLAGDPPQLSERERSECDGRQGAKPKPFRHEIFRPRTFLGKKTPSLFAPVF